jgi:CRISPR/Cas system CSM-associated protein Csm2 small subunit
MSKKAAAAAILEKSGWKEGKGLGRDEQGDVEHVKVQAKDGVLGIGYNAQVSQVWTQQAVAFADVLGKFSNGGAKKKEQESDDDDEDAENENVDKKIVAKPASGKHSVLYDKRRKLKTEGLNSAAGKSEILAAASSDRRRQRENEGAEEASDDDSGDGYKSKKELRDEKKNKGKEKEIVAPMTLSSPLLRRMTERVGAHEPKKRGEDDAVVEVKMPDPKPPKCTATPFKYQRE